MNWIKELFHPELKCARKGHSVETRKIRIRKKPDKYEPRVICYDYEAEQIRCKRCGKILETKIGKQLDWYTSVSMPQSMWDEIRENGFCIVSG